MNPLSLLKSHWFRAATAVVILCLVVLLGTPFLVRYLAQQWLMENGGEQVSFADVDFNPFTGRLVLEGLEVKVDTETTLSFNSVALDVAWLPLLRRQVEVQSLQLTGFHMVVDNRQPEAPRFGGILLPEAAPDGEPPAKANNAWLSGIKALTLKDFRILLRDRNVELDVALDSLRLSRIAQWTPEQAAVIELVGRLNDAPLRIDGQLAPFAAQPHYDLDLSVDELQLGAFEKLAAPAIGQLSGLLSYSGKLKLEQSDAVLKLSQVGKTTVESLRLAMSGPGLETSADQITHDGELAFEQSDAALKLNQSGKSAIESLHLALSEQGVETSIGQFFLDGNLAFEQSGENVSLEQAGTVSLDALDASVRQPALHVQNSKLALTTRLTFSNSPVGAGLQLASDITLENLDVKASERKVSLVSAEALKIEELLFQSLDRLSIKTINFEQIRVGKVPDKDAQAPQALARSDKLQIAGLSRAGNLIAIDSVAYEGLHNRIVRDDDGKVNVVRFIDMIEGLNAPPAASESAVEATPQDKGEGQPAEPVDLAIGSIRASQGSSIAFVDNSVKPPFATTATFEGISLEKLDTRKPQQNSPLRLQGTIGRHTRISLNGDVKPFLKPLSLDLSGTIRAMDLPALSSYTWESLGLLLDSGTLDADLKLATRDELLDGKVDLVLHQLKLGKVDSQSGLQNKLPVPMDTALNTLRDKNNTIRLTIPVEGNMADPKFDIDDAINQVLAKAVKAGALSFLTHALQPYGALITAAQYAGEAVTRVRLNPLEFEPGQATLAATGEEYLSKVAKVMQERPSIAIKLCGVAVEQDRLFFQRQQQQAAAGEKAAKQPPAQPPAVDAQKLTDLAQRRAAAVKDYLIEQHRIPASRLAGCRPRTETEEAEAKPRTELLI